MKCPPLEKHFGLQLVLSFSVKKAVHDHMTCVAQGLIGKNQPSNVDKELSGATLRDLWDNSSNVVAKPLAPIGGGVSVHRANQGKAPSELYRQAMFVLYGNKAGQKKHICTAVFPFHCHAWQDSVNTLLLL